MQKIIATPTAPAAIGPYVQAVETDHLLFTSGQLPLDPATGALAGDTIACQAAQAMDNLCAILHAAGLSCANIVKTTVYLADLQDFAAFNEVYSRYFPNAAPARSCFQVAALPMQARVEIEAIALK